MVNAQPIPLMIENSAVVVPTKDGTITVPFKEFEVVVINGQIVLVAEENPLILIPIAFYALAGGAAAGGLASLLGASVKVIKWSAVGGGIIGGLYGGTR